MTDYLEKYREALRRGDEKEANEYYNKYKGDDSVEKEEDSTKQEEEKVEESSDEEEVLKSPGDMTVDEAKEYADGIGNVEAFLELEKEGKNRTTLVDYLEDKVE